MAIHATLAGIPRIGRNRELKRALENYWRDPATGGLLAATARNTVNSYIGAALKAGIDSVPTIGRSFYDSRMSRKRTVPTYRNGSTTTSPPLAVRRRNRHPQ